jgi:hypothetical protein
MSAILKQVLAAATVCAFATAAFAQNTSMELGEGQAMYVDGSGKMSRMSVSASGHNMLMRHAKRVRAGTILYMSGGNLYMAENRRLPSSRQMLVDEIH